MKTYFVFVDYFVDLLSRREKQKNPNETQIWFFEKSD